MGSTEQHTGQRAVGDREDAGRVGLPGLPAEPTANASGESAANRYGEPAANEYGEPAGELWPAGYPAGSRRTDTWVLVCGGIAAAAAFAAAFVAAGGVAGAAGQHAVPGSTVPAVVSQACPSAAP
jgi:hypothetical protein